MNKFGVCVYDFDAYKPEVENLIEFDSYEDAFEFYFSKLKAGGNYPHRFKKSLWIVFIKTNSIVQFEQLSMTTKCHIVDIQE